MFLYELKIKITPQDRKKLIDTLKLDFVKDYADIDYFLETKQGQPREEIEEVGGRIIHRTISYDKSSGLFKIDSQDITDESSQISDYKTQPGLVEIQRTKEVYAWPGLNVSVAFDYLRGLEGLEDMVFFRVYGEDEIQVFKAKTHLVELDYRKFVTKTYIDLFSVQKPIYKEPLAWTVLIFIIGLGIFILWYFK